MVLVLAGGLVAGASLLAACDRTTPEAQLRTRIAGLQAAIEQRDVAALEDALAEDFIGPDGMDRDGARRLAQVMFLRFRDVGATLGPLDIAVRGEGAVARCTVALTGGAGALPESGRIYDLEMGWRREDGEWRLVNARWEPGL